MSHRSILVVDDDRLTRESLCEVIAELGCDPMDAADGTTALGILERTRQDLLVSDVDMPDMTGFALLGAMHQKHIEVPTVLMSGRDDSSLDRIAQEVGAKAFLHKPIQIHPFSLLVQRLLQL